jgi:hypothetical protein
MRRFAVAVALVAIGSLALVAPAGAATTAAEWRKKADDVCRNTGTVLNAVLHGTFPNGLPQPASAEDLKTLSRAAAPIFQVQHDELAALERPAKLKKQIKKLLSAFQKGVDTIASSAQGATVSGEDLNSALDPAANLARKLGLKVCGA